MQSAARARLDELERVRKQMERENEEKEAEAKQAQAQRLQDEKAAKARAASERARFEQEMKDRKTRAQDNIARKDKLQQQVQSSAEWNNLWYTASRNEGFRFMMGVFFFWLFYQTVVVGVKKRKQDYEDRVKIEQAEEEERRKMREWENEMETAEVVFCLL
jgi:hypothetical protein